MDPGRLVDLLGSSSGAELAALHGRYGHTLAGLPVHLKARLIKALIGGASSSGGGTPGTGAAATAVVAAAYTDGGGSGGAAAAAVSSTATRSGTPGRPTLATSGLAGGGSSGHLASPAPVSPGGGASSGGSGAGLSLQAALISNLLLSTRGPALTSLKNMLDAADSGHDLLHVYRALPHGTQRHLLTHIHAQAAVALAQWNGGGSGSGAGDDASCHPPHALWRPVKVYCDWDDTVQCRLWDCSFPGGTVYPGVRALLAALQEGGLYDHHHYSGGGGGGESDATSSAATATAAAGAGDAESTAAAGDALGGGEVPAETAAAPAVGDRICDTCGGALSDGDDENNDNVDYGDGALLGGSDDVTDSADDIVAATSSAVAAVAGDGDRVSPAGDAGLPDTDGDGAPPRRGSSFAVQLAAAAAEAAAAAAAADVSDASDGHSGADASTVSPAASGAADASRSVTPAHPLEAAADTDDGGSSSGAQPLVVTGGAGGAFRGGRLTRKPTAAGGLGGTLTPSASSTNLTAAGGDVNVLAATGGAAADAPLAMPLHAFVIGDGGAAATASPPPRLPSTSSSSSSPWSLAPLLNSLGFGGGSGSGGGASPSPMRRVSSERTPGSAARAPRGALASPATPSTTSGSSSLADSGGPPALHGRPRGDLILLSARPELLRSSTLRTAAAVGLSPSSVLLGSLTAALSTARMASRKLSSYSAYQALFPEYRVVLLGDSGQGDVAFGLAALEAHATQYGAALAAAAAAAAASAATAGGSTGGSAVMPPPLPPSQPPAPEVVAAPPGFRCACRHRSNRGGAGDTAERPLPLLAALDGAAQERAVVGDGGGEPAHAGAGESVAAAVPSDDDELAVDGLAPQALVAAADALAATADTPVKAAAPQSLTVQTSGASASGSNTAAAYRGTVGRLTSPTSAGGAPPASAFLPLPPAGSPARGGSGGSPRRGDEPLIPPPGLAACPPPPRPLVLIHDIRRPDQAPSTPHLDRARLRARGVHVFDCYVEAGAVAFEAGLLSGRGLRAVIDGTTGDLAGVSFPGGGAEQQRLLRLQEWQTAMRRAEMALAAAAGAAPR